MFQSTVAPSADGLKQPTERGRADCPSLKGGGTEKDFIGFAVLSTTLFPLKGEVSSHKGIFDEREPSAAAVNSFAYPRRADRLPAGRAGRFMPPGSSGTPQNKGLVMQTFFSTFPERFHASPSPDSGRPEPRAPLPPPACPDQHRDLRVSSLPAPRR